MRSSNNNLFKYILGPLFVLGAIWTGRDGHRNDADLHQYKQECQEFVAELNTKHMAINYADLLDKEELEALIARSPKLQSGFYKAGLEINDKGLILYGDQVVNRIQGQVIPSEVILRSLNSSPEICDAFFGYLIEEDRFLSKELDQDHKKKDDWHTVFERFFKNYTNYQDYKNNPTHY